MSSMWSSSVDALVFKTGAFRNGPRLPWETGQQGGSAVTLPFWRLGVAQCLGGPVRHGGLSKFRWCPFPTTPGAVVQVQPSPGPSSRVASQPWLKVHRCGAMWPAMQDQEKSVFELWRLVISSAGLATRLGRILAATEDQKAIRETWLHPSQEKLLRRSGAGRVPCWFQSLDECGGDCTYPNFSGHRGAGLQILLPAASGRSSRIPCGQVIVLSPRKLLCPCSKWSSSRRWRWKGWAAHPSSRAWMGLL